MRSNIIQSIWNSATMMTWGSFLTRSLSLVAVLPLVLNKFPVEEITLWFLFSTIIVLQLIFQMGISPTFIRIISYAMAGLSSEKLNSIKSGGLEQ
jgi:hypothetical protein